MTDAAARGEVERAKRIHAALRTITAAAGALVLGLAALVLLGLSPAALDFAAHWPVGEARGAAMLLCGYGVLALVNGVALAGFRAGDAFAYSGWLYQTMILLEAVAALGTAIAGGGPLKVALAYFLARLVGTITISVLLRRKVPWLADAPWLARPAELRALLRPALAALVLPGANAVALQGAVMAIGAVGGPAAVPAYSVVRTLSRTALQFAFRFNIAAMPRYTVFTARGEHQLAGRLVALNLAITAALVLPAAVLLVWLGGPFVRLWTGGTVDPGFALLAVMALSMLGDALWVPLSNLILAVNRHARFTYFYLAAAVVAVGLGALLAGPWGALGMAAAMLLLELAMVARVWWVARAEGMIEPGMHARGFALLREELHRGTAPAKDDAP